MGMIHLAPERPLGVTSVGKGTPVSLISNCTAIALALWLPSLVKGLEIEDTETPVKSRADTAFVKGLRVDGTGLCCTVVLATCRAN